MKKILHIDYNHPLLAETLAAAGFENIFAYESSRSEVEAMLNGVHGIVLRSRFPIDATFLDKATSLEFIARVGAGLENIDTVYAAQKNIALFAAPEGNRNAVSEHALGMLLSLMNRLKIADAQVRNGVWLREENRGFEVDGKTIGILGYGNMGKAFAKKLRGFDCEVLFYDILSGIGDANAKQVGLEELQQRSEVLSVHLPYTPQTHYFVNEDFISGFAKPFWLINTARGKNVDTAALVSALESGKILGAGLDVLEYEKSSFEALDDIPGPLAYLFQSEKVLLSPHIGGWTHESHEKLAQTIASKIVAHYKPVSGQQATPRVTGLGGFFFKATDAGALKRWYGENLGLAVDDYGCTFWWRDENGDKCSTQWSVFAQDTSYFGPSEKPFMQNFRVHDLDGLLAQLSQKGVEILAPVESFDYGKFCWILDPEGNKIELWEPIDRAFS